MKRIVIGIALVGIAVALALGGQFYWNNLRGSTPAFGPLPAVPVPLTPEPAQNTTGLPLTLPPGFGISVFAADLEGPRVLAWDPRGVLITSLPSQGTVIALPDRNHDGSADLPVIVARNLNRPHGIAFHNGKLYIAETDAVSMFDYDAETNRASNKQKIMDLPGGGNHSTRTIGFGPDGNLYISIGSTCNVCIEKDSRRATILVANQDGKNVRVYASGLRNSVFFGWHPTTKELWATDMGRDLLGDNTPSDEINIVKDGGFYGWPYCYEDRVHDTNFDPSGNASERCSLSIPPHIRFQAHSAPLGLAFVPDSWPKPYQGSLLVAFHGSWNRSVPTGYKVVLVSLDKNGTPKDQTDFLTGWLIQNGALGRPVDLLFSENGDLYLSDDKAGNIFVIHPIR